MVLDTFLNEKTSFIEGRNTQQRERTAHCLAPLIYMCSMVEYIDERELGRFLDPVIFITGLFVSISKHLDFFPSIVNESFLFCN